MNRKLAFLILIILAVGLLTIAGWGWYYYNSKMSEINYLIKGVPSYSFYEYYFPRIYADSKDEVTAAFSVKSILDYWGDSRFDLAALQEKFLFPEGDDFVDVRRFFEENGYETERLGSQRPEETIRAIKKYINPPKNMPVLVLQRRSLSPPSATYGYRVIIGISDTQKKVIVHDYYYGNNYEISYNDFAELSKFSYLAVLAIWPSEKIKGKISGPPDQNQAEDYRSRMEVMDKLGGLLAVQRTEAIMLCYSQQFDDGLATFLKFVSDHNFQYFPPSYQMFLLSELASWYLPAQRYEEAINLINGTVLPLNHDLNQPVEGWYIPPQDKFVYPYLVLIEAYLKNGQKDLAVAAYEEAKRVAVVPERKEWFEAKIKDLEKDIAAAKP